jgi:hypothetical protein
VGGLWGGWGARNTRRSEHLPLTLTLSP